MVFSHAVLSDFIPRISPGSSFAAGPTICESLDFRQVGLHFGFRAQQDPGPLGPLGPCGPGKLSLVMYRLLHADLE